MSTETKEIIRCSSPISPEGFVPDFESSRALSAAQLQKKFYDQSADFYPRDGSYKLGQLEARIALLNGVDREQVVAYGFGMQAVTDAIDVATYHQISNHQIPNLSVVTAAGMYTQNRRYMLRELRDIRGLDVKEMDSGDHEGFLDGIKRRQPNLVVAETIGNFLTTPVLDIDGVLSVSRSGDQGPTIVLDNTVPLSTGQSLADKLNEGDNVIVVESGTKSCTTNNSALGIAWSPNPELVARLREYRRIRGTIIEPDHARQKLEIITGSREEYDERNRKIFQNTADIARMIFEVNEETKDSRKRLTDLTISHPTLPDHDNHDYYAGEYPDEASPIFYIQTNDSSITKDELLDLFHGHPGVSEHVAIRQSFGFDNTGIQHDEYEGFTKSIRIAAGYRTDVKKLGSLLASAVRKI